MNNTTSMEFFCVNLYLIINVTFSVNGIGTVPFQNTDLQWVSKWQKTGSVVDMKTPGPPKTACTPENVGRARAPFLHSPGQSARKQVRALDLPRSSLARVINNDLRSIKSRLFKN